MNKPIDPRVQAAIEEADARPRRETVSLLDLKRRSALIGISPGQVIEVYALTAATIEGLLERFPDLQQWITGRGIDVKRLSKIPSMMSGVIAAAVDKLGDEEYERAAYDRLTPEDQVAILEQVMAISFTNGFGPFADRAAAMFTGRRAAPAGMVQATRSPISSPPIADQPPSTPGASPLDSSQPSPTSTESVNSETSTETFGLEVRQGPMPKS